MKIMVYCLAMLIWEMVPAINLYLISVEGKIHDVNTNVPSAEDFYTVYMLYRNGDRRGAIQSMKDLGANLQSNFLFELEPAGVVDSLVFDINNGGTRVTFHAIDLLYEKFIDATFSTTSNESVKSIDNLVQLWMGMGLQTKQVLCNVETCYLFEDNNEIWVVDKRWRKWNYEKYTSLYKYLIFVDEDFLVINLAETVPLHTVDPMNVPDSIKYRTELH